MIQCSVMACETSWSSILDCRQKRKPIIMADRRASIALRSKLEPELTRLVKLNVLAPVNSPSPRLSQIVVTNKKSGQIQVCIDPHELNKALCHKHYTLP